MHLTSIYTLVLSAKKLEGSETIGWRKYYQQSFQKRCYAIATDINAAAATASNVQTTK